MTDSTMMAVSIAMMPTEQPIKNTHDQLLFKLEFRIYARKDDIASKRNPTSRSSPS